MCLWVRTFYKCQCIHIFRDIVLQVCVKEGQKSVFCVGMVKTYWDNPPPGRVSAQTYFLTHKSKLQKRSFAD